MRRLAFLLVLVLTGCGGGNAWTQADTKAITTVIQTQRALTVYCRSDAGCSGDQVQLVETSAECNLGSMGARHGADVLDGGGALGCQSQLAP